MGEGHLIFCPLCRIFFFACSHNKLRGPVTGATKAVILRFHRVMRQGGETHEKPKESSFSRLQNT